MTSEVVPIPLPWKRPYKGLMVAELGLASFRVERKEDGWTCGVQVDKKRMQVLAKGLARQRDGQCRAEAYAATLPEEIKARQSPTAQPGGPPTSGDLGSVENPVMRPRSGEETLGPVPADPVTPDLGSSQVIDPTPAVAFERVDDGCICGRMKNGMWVADPKGCVTLPRGASAEDANQIRKFAAEYFARPATPASTAATSASTAPTTPSVAPQVMPAGEDRLAKARAVRAAKAAAKQAGEQPASARSSSGAAKKSDASKPKPGAAGKGAAKTDAPARSPVKKSASSKRAATSDKPSEGPAKKTSASKRLAKKDDASKGTAKKNNASKKTSAIKGANDENRRPAKKGDASKGPAKKGDASKGPAKKDDSSKGPAKKGDVKETAGKQGPAPAAGAPPLKWHDVDGQPRANTPFGAFSIEPEGDHQALYFYDLNGQSFFLGNRGDLRKIADERAARGGVMPSVSRRSGELDAQLRGMIINVGEDMR
jgi:hypothetical protein